MSPAVVCCCLVLLAACSVNSARNVPFDPEVDYSALQLITSKGYPGEEHWVTTSDGYILGLHRIHHQGNQTKGVFFLQHGLLCSSTNWLTNLANESLAYILYDHGYDVWMGNVRGNTYSRNHTTLKTNTEAFWNFSFDEHSQIDLPAMLDYVVNVTKEEKVFYVGHSQGTIMGFAGFSENQTLAKYVRVFFALAPVAKVKHIQGAFKFIADHNTEIAPVLDIFTHGEFIPNYPIVKLFAKYACTVDMEVEGLCGNIIFLICGFDKDNLNVSRVPVYFTHSPAGTSIKNTLHLSQEVHSGRFAMYDYGKELNIKKYGVDPSPAYDVSNLTVPMALFTGGKDWLADPTDVAGLLPLLNKTGHLIFHKNVDYYDHLDFIWAMDSPTVIYKDILTLAGKY